RHGTKELQEAQVARPVDADRTEDRRGEHGFDPALDQLLSLELRLLIDVPGRRGSTPARRLRSTSMRTRGAAVNETLDLELRASVGDGPRTGDIDLAVPLIGVTSLPVDSGDVIDHGAPLDCSPHVREVCEIAGNGQ